MKNSIILTLLFAGLFLTSFAQERIRITGKLDVTTVQQDPSKAPYKVLLSNQVETLDSCIIENGSFTLETILTDVPEYLTVGIQNRSGWNLKDQNWGAYLLDGQLHLSGRTLASASVTGTPEILKMNEDLQNFAKQTAHLSDSFQLTETRLFDNLTDSQRADSIYMQKLNTMHEQAYINFERLKYQETCKYVEEHPGHYASFVELLRTSQIFLNPMAETIIPGGAQELKEMFGKLSPDVQQRFAKSSIHDKLNSHTMNNPGKQLESFSLTGLDGKIVSTEALRGQVFILDFWGSWCIACRDTHPHMIELYNKYKDQGLEIISVAQEYGSPSVQVERWKKAVAEDKLPWLNILNNAEGVDLVKRFGIYSYPVKFLVDRDGKILWRFSVDSEGELDRKLAALFPEGS